MSHYSTFHFMNQRSLNVMPMFILNVFSLSMPGASERTHWPDMFSIERLLYAFTIGMPKPTLTLISSGPSCPFTL